jgi:hypothetical protein
MLFIILKKIFERPKYGSDLQNNYLKNGYKHIVGAFLNCGGGSKNSSNWPLRVDINMPIFPATCSARIMKITSMSLAIQITSFLYYQEFREEW